MIASILTKVFGSKNERVLKDIQPLVYQINELESQIEHLDDSALAAKTVEFRQRVDKGESLEDLLPETFAVIREASKRVLGERHFDVQLLGGVVLHRGCIAEMKTGEGKTLTSTLPVYLNSLTGKGVHVVTVNDYLATRDAEWMGQVYRFLGMSAGRIVHDMDDAERREAYRADVLEHQLHQQTVAFINDPSRGTRWDEERQRLMVSKIFKWFKSTFISRKFFSFWTLSYQKIRQCNN